MSRNLCCFSLLPFTGLRVVQISECCFTRPLDSCSRSQSASMNYNPSAIDKTPDDNTAKFVAFPKSCKLSMLLNLLCRYFFVIFYVDSSKVVATPWRTFEICVQCSKSSKRPVPQISTSCKAGASTVARASFVHPHTFNCSKAGA